VSSIYPIFLDLSGRVVVIVGGGAVAVRKAAGAVAAGAGSVRCIAPAISDEMHPAVERVLAEYSDKYLDGADLVFAATDRPQVNDAVVRDARRRKILVNRADADAAEPGDFILPARLDEGPVVIAVSAGSAALSAALRDDLAARIDRRYVAMAEAMKILRPQIRASSLDQHRRAEVFRELAGNQALSALDAGGMDGLRAWLHERFAELNHG
jgi:siroheme synthase-like protein